MQIDKIIEIGKKARLKYNNCPKTELGNAERHARINYESHKHSEKRGDFVYDGKRFVNSEAKAFELYIRTVLPLLYAEAGAVFDDMQHSRIPESEKSKTIQAATRHAIHSEAANRIAAAIRLARTDSKITIDEDAFDKNPLLFNCKNGTFNFETGKLQPHDRKDLISKISNVEYDPEAEAPIFNKFISTIFDNDKDMIRFMQKSLGYTATGLTNEQKIWILLGVGANGKSVLTTAISEALGEYACQCSPELLLKTNDSEDKRLTQIARLVGARFAQSQETDEGRALAEAAIKTMTGGEKLVGRHLYQSQFTFEASHKLWLATNSRPIIKGTNEGIWRRILLVPFDVRIPPAEQDKNLSKKLAREGAGIFNWLAEGYRLYRAEGLCIPKKVTDAVSAYRGDSDILTAFIDQNCIIKQHGQGASVSVSELYDSYQSFCESEGEYCKSNRYFSTALKDKGFDKIKQGKIWFWRGILLDNDSDTNSNTNFKNDSFTISEDREMLSEKLELSENDELFQ